MKSKEELNALKEEVENVGKKLAELTEEELEQVSGGKVPPINRDEKYVMLSGGVNDWESNKLPTEPGNYKLTADSNTIFTPWME